MFHNAQEFYEHLDDCVLRVVQQEEPSEAINEQRLAEVGDDPAVQESLDRQIPAALQFNGPNQCGFEENGDEVDEFKEELMEDVWQNPSHGNARSGKGNLKTAAGASS